MQMNDNLACAVNAFSGCESEQEIASGKRKVVIIGAGTAGLEAARLAAVAGHTVTVFEQQQQLGGSLRLASTVHKDNELFLNWLLSEVKLLNIDFRLGVTASVDTIIAENPDHILVASGAVVTAPPIPGIEQPHILTGRLIRQIMSGNADGDELWRVSMWLQRLLFVLLALVKKLSPQQLRWLSKLWLPLGKVIVIVGADLVAVELAEFLAERGRKVYLLDEGKKLIPEVGKKRRNEHMDRLDQLKVVVNTSVSIQRIENKTVFFSVLAKKLKISADNIIVAGKPVAEMSLADNLRAKNLPVQAIGDCSGLGLIAGATRDAAQAVANIQ
ncbi:FAD-dependent oxidoreductase [Oceanicoccus sp. KOV_DT_Chl]|uniref:FAD-dependent oxidoreductase n=1 Tax=Oceanicoccus sp. KOV_DT_Chl TaxID=1904639 RepID=UPI00350FEA07